MSVPSLRRSTVDGVSVWTDPGLLASGVVVGFSERRGGVSEYPFASLNLAAHVGDDAACVDENRTRLLKAAGLEGCRGRLTVAEQVHGDFVAVVDADSAGAGALASTGRAPLSATDALVTTTPDVPLMLCFADCVPVILVAPGPAVALAHAGWRGALGSISGSTARELARVAACDTAEIRAYIGAHVRACHYPVGEEVMSQFVDVFGAVARAASGGLDLDVIVTASLVDAGVTPRNIARLGTCTAEATDRFFSYRSEDGRTGRHGAFACVLSGGSSASL